MEISGVTSQTALPVFDSVRAAFGFFTQNWTRFAPAAALAAVGAVAFSQALAQPTGPGLLIGAAAGFLSATVYRAALFRYALNGEYGGLFGMRLSSDEARLAGVSLLLLLFMALIFMVCIVPLALVVTGMAAAAGDPAALEAAVGDPAATLEALGGPARTVMAMGWAGIFCLLLFVGVRLTLSAPATMAEGRVVFLKSWPWTKGSFFRLLAALVLAMLPGALAEVTLSAAAGAAAEAGAGALAGILLFGGAFAGALIGGMMGVGLLVFLYRGLRPPEAAA